METQSSPGTNFPRGFGFDFPVPTRTETVPSPKTNWPKPPRIGVRAATGRHVVVRLRRAADPVSASEEFVVAPLHLEGIAAVRKRVVEHLQRGEIATIQKRIVDHLQREGIAAVPMRAEGVAHRQPDVIEALAVVELVVQDEVPVSEAVPDSGCRMVPDVVVPLGCGADPVFVDGEIMADHHGRKVVPVPAAVDLLVHHGRAVTGAVPGLDVREVADPVARLGLVVL